MTEPEAPPRPESVTAWHPMLVALLDIYLPSGWQLIPELLLSRLPQRVDIVVIELVGTTKGAVRKLHSIFDYLRPHTLIEHKGPTDDLAAEDALVLLGYAAQYMRLKKLKDPADLCLMVVSDRITPGFLDGALPLDEEGKRVYATLQNQVEQFRKSHGAMTMKDYELMQMSMAELARFLTPTFERLAREEPQKLASMLTPEELAGALTPEQLAKVLTPEQRAKTLEALLPPDVWEQVKHRLH